MWTKLIKLKAYTGPKVSRRFRLQNFKTIEQESQFVEISKFHSHIIDINSLSCVQAKH